MFKFFKKKDGVKVGKPISDVIKPICSSKNSPLISIKGISKSYKKKLVLKDINFDILKGDIFGLIGMSGSGKTTMFQLLSGLIKPDAGDILVQSDLLFKNKKNLPDYISVFKNTGVIKKHFGFASQMPSFYEHLTVEENIRMYGALYSLDKKKLEENMSRLMNLVDLHSDKDTIASELSGGMQRRLDIACALIHEPKVLFLDEPTSDLDPVMRKQIWNLIKEINGKGTTIIIASHILEEIETLCKKVAILHDKKVIGHGTIRELKKHFKKSKQVRVCFENDDYTKLIKKLRREKGINRLAEQDGYLLINLAPDDTLVRKIIRSVESHKEELISLEISDASLTEIFETITKKRKE